MFIGSVLEHSDEMSSESRVTSSGFDDGLDSCRHGIDEVQHDLDGNLGPFGLDPLPQFLHPFWRSRILAQAALEVSPEMLDGIKVR